MNGTPFDVAGLDGSAIENKKEIGLRITGKQIKERQREGCHVIPEPSIHI
jgi:hypothetical protein